MLPLSAIMQPTQNLIAPQHTATIGSSLQGQNRKTYMPLYNLYGSKKKDRTEKLICPYITYMVQKKEATANLTNQSNKNKLIYITKG